MDRFNSHPFSFSIEFSHFLFGALKHTMISQELNAEVI
jgi:hypothetical protein